MAKILLVEDDNNLRDIYGERLLAEGYDIISASDGEEALQMAAQQKPDLIISDVMMPKISGFDMLDILRQTPETKDVKIIMMTALSQSEDKSRAEKLGADKYLVKSQVTLEDVARVVHDLLGDTPAEEAEEASEPASAATEPSVSAQPVAPAPEPAAVPEPTAPVTPTPPAPVVAEPTAAANNTTQADNTQAPAPADDSTTPAAPVVPPPVVPEPTNAPVDDAEANPTSTTLPSVPNIDDLPSDPMPSTTPMVGQLDTKAGDSTPAAPGTAAQTFAPTENANPASPAPEKPAEDTPVASDDVNTNSASVNPISGMAAGVMNTGDAQEQSNSAASSTDEEMADVQKQIESFVAQESEVSDHTEPLKEPSEQDLIHAKNANEDPKVVPAASAPGAQSTPTVPDSEQAAPPVEPNPTIPPIIKPALDTANPEPASNRKKIIQPINDVSAPDIHKLYEQQMAEEAANSNMAAATQTQVAEQPAQPAEQVAPQIQEEQVFNPIADSNEKPEEQSPELETIDVSSITGMQEPEEDDSELPIPGQLPSTPAAVDSNTDEADETMPVVEPVIPVDPAQPAVAPETDNSQEKADEKPIDPNDPNNFAL